MLLEEGKLRLDALDKSLIPNYGRNKGGRGQSIEQMLGLPNGMTLLDFVNGEGKSFKTGQTIAVTMLQHCLDEVFDRSVSYSESKVGRKLANVLFIKFSKSGEYVSNLVSNAETYKELYYKLSCDYNDICEEIRRRFNNNEGLNTITGSNKLLQIRTKASKKSDGTYTPLEYNGQRLKDKAMAFYLTITFEKALFS
tara:strand:- start:44 stop:631 length:588 start_codon:yes stop_codon:yes gene_type:complete